MKTHTYGMCGIPWQHDRKAQAHLETLVVDLRVVAYCSLFMAVVKSYCRGHTKMKIGDFEDQ